MVLSMVVVMVEPGCIEGKPLPQRRTGHTIPLVELINYSAGVVSLEGAVYEVLESALSTPRTAPHLAVSLSRGRTKIDCVKYHIPGLNGLHEVSGPAPKPSRHAEQGALPVGQTLSRRKPNAGLRGKMTS